MPKAVLSNSTSNNITHSQGQYKRWSSSSSRANSLASKTMMESKRNKNFGRQKIQPDLYDAFQDYEEDNDDEDLSPDLNDDNDINVNDNNEENSSEAEEEDEKYPPHHNNKIVEIKQNYDISLQLANIIRRRIKYLKTRAIYTQNTADRLYNGSDYTPIQVAAEIKYICAKGGSTFAQQQQLERNVWRLLKKILPQDGLQLPNESSKSSYGSSPSVNDSILPLDYRLLKFDICKRGCTVWPAAATRASDLICGICKANRFHPCCKCKKVDNDDEEDPTILQCFHFDNRIAVKSLNYLPIIPLLTEMIETTGFHLFLNYEFIKHCDEQSSIEDVMDSKAAKTAFLQMQENYLQADMAQCCRENNNRQECMFEHKPVNLVFSVFYDGVQLFKSKATHFSPLVLSILNFPPNIRNVLGIGKLSMYLLHYYY
jgi:hypothetical protein